MKYDKWVDPAPKSEGMTAEEWRTRYPRPKLDPVGCCYWETEDAHGKWWEFSGKVGGEAVGWREPWTNSPPVIEYEG